MLHTARSFATRDGKAYFKRTGRSNEFTKQSKHLFRNDAPSALKQKKLVIPGDRSGAALTTEEVKKDLEL